MPETLADRVPVWARPYVPTSDYYEDSFVNSVGLDNLTESRQTQSVKDEFTIQYPTASNLVSVERSKTLEKETITGNVIFRRFSNEIRVSKTVGFYGVKIEAKSYKRDEVQYIRKFPTDSFPFGVVSLDNSGRSIYSQKLQYGKQLVIAPQILQLCTFLLQLGLTQKVDELKSSTLNAINGRLYYPNIPADVSFLAVYELCIIRFATQS